MKKYQDGQILLAVVLVMVVALTVGLSLAVRATTNIRTSSEEESSQRAFSAAEAGIEQALANPTPAGVSLTNNSSYSTTIGSLSGSAFILNNGATILKDDPADVWLSTYPSYTNPWPLSGGSGSLTINWGSASDPCSDAALEIVIISGSKASPQLTHYAEDACVARQTTNKFEVPVGGDSVKGTTFKYKKIISITSGLIARIIPLYAPSVIGVEGDSQLPVQGTIVTSTGVSDNTQRKIVSFQGYPKIPTGLFPFIVFSPR